MKDNPVLRNQSEATIQNMVTKRFKASFKEALLKPSSEVNSTIKSAN